MTLFRKLGYTAALLATGAFIGLGAIPDIALAQSPPAQVQQINPGDLFPDMVNGQASPYTSYASGALLTAFQRSQPTLGNLIIGGNADTNLWQDGTAGVAATTTVGYCGADEWVCWSGTNTQVKIIEDTADTAPAGYVNGFKLQRTSGQTGVVQVCMAHEVRSVIAYQAQGTTVELDFHDFAGSNFSAAGGAYSAAIVYGTAANEGTTDLAFGYNAGGGGSVGWTGQANAAQATFAAGALNRNALVASIPTTAKELGVVFCFTPVGTASTNDYLALWGIQLVRNPGNAQYASATVGRTCSQASGGSSSGPGIPCASFDRTRTNVTEAALQYADYYRVSETGTAGTNERGLCRSRSITTCSWDVKFPVPMNAAPTVTLANGFAVETTAAGGTLNNCTLTNDTTISTAVASTTDAYVLCTATTVPAAGTVDQVFDNNGTGAVKASARL